jgi:hypothetical protein
LAALVPKPRVNLTRFHGVFAPNSNFRAFVTPAKRGKGNKPTASGENQAQTPAERRASMTWVQCLKRVFNIDVETCRVCGGTALPGYVEREFENYLKCGRLEHGFLRVRCDSCHAEHLVAFSCKRRGFCLSLRGVEDLLAERGIVVSYESIQQWCNRFGPEYARTLKKRRGRLGDIWHLDEVFIKINGELHYL